MCMSVMMLEELKVADELPCHSAKLSKTLTFSHLIYQAEGLEGSSDTQLLTELTYIVQ